jgi:hypothetical protein
LTFFDEGIKSFVETVLFKLSCCTPFSLHFAFELQFLFGTVLSLPLSHALPITTTTQRLGAVAASTAGYAAHGFLISHEKFMRGTAAVAPNRKLAAGDLSVSHSYHHFFYIGFTLN